MPPWPFFTSNKCIDCVFVFSSGIPDIPPSQNLSGSNIVNSLAIDKHPGSQFPQDIFLLLRDLPIRFRLNIQEHGPAFGTRFNQSLDPYGCRESPGVSRGASSVLCQQGSNRLFYALRIETWRPPADFFRLIISQSLPHVEWLHRYGFVLDTNRKDAASGTMPSKLF